MRYYLSSGRVALTKNIIINACLDAENGKLLHIVDGIVNSSAIMEKSMEIPHKTKTQSPYDPAVSLLGIYPKEMKCLYHSDSLHALFNAAPFAITMLWNQLRCSSMDE